MKYLLWTILLITVPATAQRSSCSQNTGNNASVFVDKAGAPEIQDGDRLLAFSSSGCVGEAVLNPSASEVYHLTVWGDDEITPEVDGLTAGEPIVLALAQNAEAYSLNNEPPFSSSISYAPDKLLRIATAVFDTTTARELADLNAQIDQIGAELDTAYAIADFLNAELAAANTRGDSLQVIVDQQRVNITDLQAQLTQANATIDSLQIVIDNMPDCAQCEADLAAAQQQITDLQTEISALQDDVMQLNAQLVAANDKLRQIAQVANSNKGRYREILDILYP